MPISPQSLKSSQELSMYDPVSAPIWHRDVFVLLKIKRTATAPLGELSVFCQKVSFLLDAGIPVKTALATVQKELAGHCIPRVLPGISSRVNQGESFSAAARASGVFPGFFCGFVAIGEATAKLPQVMAQLADFYEDQAQTRDELIAALVYPVVVSVMMIGVIILAVTFVLPGYSRVFAAGGVPMPGLTRGLMQMSEFLAANALLVAAAVLLLIFGAALFMQSPQGRGFAHWVKLRFPLTRQGVNYRFARALSLLLLAGLPVSRAVPLTRDVMDNTLVRRDLEKISTRLSAGTTFSDALGELPYIDPLMVGLARVGEETGNMPQTMDKCQLYYATQYKRGIKRVNKLVEPVITLVLGAGLGIIVLAVILPTFELATVM